MTSLDQAAMDLEKALAEFQEPPDPDIDSVIQDLHLGPQRLPDIMLAEWAGFDGGGLPWICTRVERYADGRNYVAKLWRALTPHWIAPSMSLPLVPRSSVGPIEHRNGRARFQGPFSKIRLHLDECRLPLEPHSTIFRRPTRQRPSVSM